MELQLFFGTPIAMISNLVDDEYNQKVKSRLQEIQEARPEPRQSWNCDVYTSHNMFDLTQDKVFDELLYAQKEKVDVFTNSITNRDSSDCKIVNSWFNVAKEGQYQDQHIHSNCHISTIYYAKAPEGSAPTIFKSLLPDQVTFGSVLNNDVVVPPVERSFIIFLSNVPHLTGQHKLKESRITVASNYEVT